MDTYVKEKTFKERFEEAKAKLKEGAHKAGDWCKRNPQVVIPAVGGLAVGTFKYLRKEHQMNKERDLKDRYIYDRSMGHYYEMKRQPKPSEWILIEERKQNGESIGMILESMRLLK